jgi:DNA-binding CsgD family transcriptional regulator
MSPSPALESAKKPKKLLILGYDAAASTEFDAVFQPSEILNKLDLQNISRRDLLQFDPDVVICSRDAFRALLSSPPASIADDPKLTARQREILLFVQKGLTNREIAGVTGLRERAVKGEVATLFAHFEVANRTELAAVPAA